MVKDARGLKDTSVDMPKASKPTPQIPASFAEAALKS